MIHDYGFDDNLAYAEGSRKVDVLSTIRSLLVGCGDLRLATRDEQRKGIDFVAALRGGATVYIDEKTRRPGAARFWKGEPDLALETLSVLEQNIVGWTLSESKETDLILYTYDPADTEVCYLVAFQPLRLAFRRNQYHWISEYGRNGQPTRQSTDAGRYHSESVYVPASVVLDAIRRESRAAVELQESLF